MSEGGQLLIWGMRHWMLAMLEERCVPQGVVRSFELIGGAPLYDSLTAMVLLAARDADRPLRIHPPCCGELSADEVAIARILAALTVDDAGASVQFRSLLGCEPSSALRRNAATIAAGFKAVGLRVSVGDLAPHEARNALSPPFLI